MITGRTLIGFDDRSLLSLRGEELQATEDDHVELQVLLLLLVEDLVSLEHDDAATLQDGTDSLEAELSEERVQTPQLVERHVDRRDAWYSRIWLAVIGSTLRKPCLVPCAQLLVPLAEFLKLTTV